MRPLFDSSSPTTAKAWLRLLLQLMLVLHHLSPSCTAKAMQAAAQKYKRPAASSPEGAALLWRLDSEEARCYNDSLLSAALDAYSGGGGFARGHCPAVFDGFLCWPRTPAGGYVRLPCPAGVFLARGGSAWRECMPDGRWRFPAGAAEPAVASDDNDSASVVGGVRASSRLLIGSSYSNYTECVPSELYADVAEKLRVTFVLEEQQPRRLTLERRLCAMMAASHRRRQRVTESSAANASGCAPTFDNVICWAGAPAGSRVYRSCPDYLNEVNRQGFAWRVCLHNGSWFLPPGMPPNRTGSSGEGWTNFTDCFLTMKWNPWEGHLAIIHIGGHIGYGISLVFLLLAIFILAAFRRLHCQKNAIHINLFAAFALRAVNHFFNSLIVQDSPGQNGNSPLQVKLCRFQQTLMTYCVISSYTWVFVEALHLYMLIFVNTMSNSKLSTASYMAIGWGAPCIVTGIWVTLRILLDNRHCWLEYTPMGPDIWLVNVYLCLLVFVNAALFVRIVRELFVKLRNQPRTSQASQNYRKLWKSTSVLVFVLGIYQLIFLPLSVMPKNKLGVTLDMIKLSYDHFFNSFQGFFVSLLFCFVNSEVHNELKRHLLDTKVGKWLKGRGYFQPLEDVYGLDPATRRANRRDRGRVNNGVTECLPLNTTQSTTEAN